jgi:hypothetical protein
MISCALIALALGGLLFIILPDCFQSNEASQTQTVSPEYTSRIDASAVHITQLEPITLKGKTPWSRFTGLTDCIRTSKKPYALNCRAYNNGI